MVEKYGQTDFHPLALTLTLLMGLAMLVVRRERAAIPLLIVACFIPHAHRIVVGDLDFSMLRLVVLFGWVRVLSRGEFSSYRRHRLDDLIVLWQLFANLAYVFGPRATMAAFVLRLGLTLDALGIYFLFRTLLRDVRDVRLTVSAFGWIALVLVGPMMIENLTGRNVFSALGGVPEITRIRDGRMRCQGSFSHPITAGNFGAATAAMLLGLWITRPATRVASSLTLAAAVGVTILSASSGPLLALIAAVLGWGLWQVRQHMRAIRWGTTFALIVIHFAREKPVWHLIGRISQLTGGTGWHRYRLIDEFIAHFHEWWFLGGFTTRHWGIPQAMDITNQYVVEGLRGGLPTLLSFVAVLAIGFRTVGRSVKRAVSSPILGSSEARKTGLLTWGLGVCLFAHSVAFIGVSYFGQLMSIFYIHLAMIPAMAFAIPRLEERRANAAAAFRQPQAASRSSTHNTSDRG